jgi:hypothetical protein
MDDSSGRARGDAAREAAERAAAVDAMLQEAQDKGWVPLERDAVDYIPLGDGRLVEVVEGGHEWARYAARVKGGGVYLEGGARRQLWTTDKAAARLLQEKAAAACREERLFTLLEIWRLARATRGEGRCVGATLWADERLRQKLADRIRERAVLPEAAGSVRRSDHQEILAELGVSDAERRRLRADRSVPAEERAAAVAPARDAQTQRDRDALAAALAAARGRKDAVVLSGADAPSVAPDGTDVELFLERPDADWACVAVLAGGDVHFEGGLRRERLTTAKTAEKLVKARVDALLADRDVRRLIWLRRQLERAEGAWSAVARIAADPRLRERLDAALRAGASGWTADPPLSAAQVGELRAAGVDEAALAALAAPSARTAAGGGGAGATPRDEERAAALAAAIAAAGGRKDAVALEGADAPFLAPEAPEIELLVERPDSDWSYAAVLQGGDVHFEAGLQRRRLTTAKAAEKVVKQRIEGLLGDRDLRRLVWLRRQLAAARGEWHAEARIAADPKLRERLDAALRDLAAACRPDPPLSALQVGELRAAGVDETILSRLAGRAAAPRAAAGARTGAGARRAQDERSAALAAAVEAARARPDAVLLEGADAPFVGPDAAEVELLVERPDPDWSYAVVLVGGDVHFEGGLRRERLTTARAAGELLAARIEALLSDRDIRLLVWLRRQLDRAKGAWRAEARIAADPLLRARLDEAIRGAAVDYHADPPLAIAQAGELRAAGVDEDTILRLAAPDARVAVRSAAARAAAVAQTAYVGRGPTSVARAVTKRLAMGFRCLAEDVVAYLPADDERVREVLVGRPDWATYAVLLDDDSVHVEGGVIRLRVSPEARLPDLFREAIERLLGQGTLWALLDVQATIEAGPRPGTLAAHVLAEPELAAALRARVHELVRDERYTGHVARPAHRAALRALGVPAQRLAELAPAG